MRVIGTLVMVTALGMAGCGDDSDDGAGNDTGDGQRALVDALVDEGATRAAARCVVDELGDDAERILTTGTPDLSEADTSRLLEAVTECAPEELDE